MKVKQLSTLFINSYDSLGGIGANVWDDDRYLRVGYWTLQRAVEQHLVLISVLLVPKFTEPL